MATSFFGGEFFGGEFFNTPPPPSSSGGGAGAGYNTANLDPAKWARNKRKLEKQAEAVQKKIQKVRTELNSVIDLEAIEKLKKRIADLNKNLLELLASIDEANKAYEKYEEEEVLTVYMIYRTLH